MLLTFVQIHAPEGTETVVAVNGNKQNRCSLLSTTLSFPPGCPSQKQRARLKTISKFWVRAHTQARMWQDTLCNRHYSPHDPTLQPFSVTETWRRTLTEHVPRVLPSASWPCEAGTTLFIGRKAEI